MPDGIILPTGDLRAVLRHSGLHLKEPTIEYIGDVISRPRITPPGGLLRGITCCNCAKDIPYTQWEIRQTPATNLSYVYALHRDRKCRGELENVSAVVVCVNCRSMLMIRTDEKKAVDGFVLRRKKVYHITECAYCNPTATSITIVEQQIASRQKEKHNHE